jgi:hypothetical protein
MCACSYNHSKTSLTDGLDSADADADAADQGSMLAHGEVGQLSLVQTVWLFFGHGWLSTQVGTH